MMVRKPAGKSMFVSAVAALALGACGGPGSGDSPQVVPYVEAIGVLDASFQADGLAPIPVPYANSRVTEIAELDDGSLLVGGSNPFIAKANAQGKVDISFAMNGVDSTRRGTRIFQEVRNITPLSPERIAIVEEHFSPCIGSVFGCAISTFSDVVARRIDAAGKADPTYGNGGLGVLPFSEGAIVVTPSGRVMSFTIRPGDPAKPSELGVASLDPEGQRDAGFEARALSALQCSGRSDPPLAQIRSVGAARAGDKVIVAAGFLDLSSTSYGYCISRLNADGTIDSSFAELGHQVFSLPVSSAQNVFRVLMRSRGDIVVVLRQFNLLPPVLLFLTASGAKDTSVVPGGVQSQPIILVDSIYDLTLQPNGKIVAVGTNSLAPGVPTRPLDEENPRVTRSSAMAGSYDAGFGLAPVGFAVLKTAAGPVQPGKVFIDRQGRILVGGYLGPTNSPAVLRLR